MTDSDNLARPLHEARVVELLERIVAGIDGLNAQLRAKAVASASPLLTRHQVAALFQVDERTLRRLELEGAIPSAVAIGGVKRWRRADVDSFLAKAKAS